MPIKRLTVLFLFFFTLSSFAQTPFNGLNQWRGALAASDATSLKSVYAPDGKYLQKGGSIAADLSEEFAFWQQVFKDGASGISVRQIGEKDQQGLHLLNLVITMKVKTPKGLRTRYVVEQQGWQQQGSAWKIMIASHSELLKMQPVDKPSQTLYNKDANAKAGIAAAVASAAKLHKRVILVFGGNWCYDCHVLDQAFHQPDVASIVTKNFEVVHVDIGDEGKKNVDLMAKYKIPVEKGFPALAILAPDGKLLYSQQNGEWESARSLDPDDVVAFLNKWKP